MNTGSYHKFANGVTGAKCQEGIEPGTRVTIRDIGAASGYSHRIVDRVLEVKEGIAYCSLVNGDAPTHGKHRGRLQCPICLNWHCANDPCPNCEE